MSRTTRAAVLALAVAATTLAAPEDSAPLQQQTALPGVRTAALALDVDADGLQDLVVALATGPRLVLLRGTLAGRFASPTPLADLPSADASRVLGLVSVDVDLDGLPDLLGAGSPATVWFAQGDGSFVPRELSSQPASHVACTDLDRDGDPDVLLVTPAGLTVLRNEGGGQFAESGAVSIAGAWPVRALDVSSDDLGEALVTVSGGAADATLQWRAEPDGVLVRTDAEVAVMPLPPTGDALATADFDRDGHADVVRADPAGAAAIVVESGAPSVTVSSEQLSLLSGRLRGLQRASDARVRVTVRSRLPEALRLRPQLRPQGIVIGDPAHALAFTLAPSGWTSRSETVDVWRGGRDSARLAVVLDRRRGTLTFNAARVRFPFVPEAEVEFAIEWDGARAVHRAEWTRSRKGDLVYRPARAPEVSPPVEGDLAAGLKSGEHLSSEFVTFTRMINGRRVTLIRHRRSGRVWRFSRDGKWKAVDARGRFIKTTKKSASSTQKKRSMVQLHFRGPVDGSDEIRIDGGGALWTNRHWGMPHGSVTLNGVPWTPRAGRALANSGKTRFLAPGVDFSTARLVRSSGRDLLALEVAADHITLKVSDSPNGPGQYEAVISIEVGRVVKTTTSLGEGLLAHLPLTSDLSDRAEPQRKLSAGAAKIEGGAAVFNGKGSLDLPHLVLAGRPFAFAMHVRVDGDADTMGLVDQRAAHAAGRHLHLMLRGKQRPYLGFYNNDLRAPDPVPRDGKFHHLVFQYTGSEQEIWMDGKRVAHRRAAPYRGKSGATRLGRNPNWNNVGRSNLVGALRDVRVYGRSLSASEVAKLAK